MRCGFDRLAELAGRDRQDPFHAHLFIFRSNEVIVEGAAMGCDGYALWYKRLESESSNCADQARCGAVELRLSEFAMLLDGIDMSRVKRMPRYHRNNDEVREGCVLTG